MPLMWIIKQNLFLSVLYNFIHKSATSKYLTVIKSYWRSNPKIFTYDTLKENRMYMIFQNIPISKLKDLKSSGDVVFQHYAKVYTLPFKKDH